MEFQKINQSKRKQDKKKKKQKQMRQIKNKRQDDRFKPKHIKIYIKYKYSKNIYEKAEIVQLDKKILHISCKKQT